MCKTIPWIPVPILVHPFHFHKIVYPHIIYPMWRKYFSTYSQTLSHGETRDIQQFGRHDSHSIIVQYFNAPIGVLHSIKYELIPRWLRISLTPDFVFPSVNGTRIAKHVVTVCIGSNNPSCFESFEPTSRVGFVHRRIVENGLANLGRRRNCIDFRPYTIEIAVFFSLIIEMPSC